MLSSIHPLGERARNNRWGLTVAAFTLGAVVSGATVGLVLGAVGSVLFPVDPSVLVAGTAIVALVAGILDLSGLRPPGPARQVNENWIGAFRGWVYGGGFGVELGLGMLTYVVTWGIYAVFLASVFTTSPLSGALVGATFGLGRSLSLIAAGFVDRPSRLTLFNRRIAQAGPMVRRGTEVTFAILGAVVLAGGLL